MSFVSRTFGVILVLLFPALPCAAQSVQAGVKFGVAVTSLSNASTITQASDESWSALAEMTAGGFVTLARSERFAIQPEFLFVTKGVEQELESAAEVGAASVLLRYLEVPLLVKFSKPASGTLLAYLLAGPSVGFRMSATHHLGTDSGEEVDVSDRVDGVDVGLTLGGGVQGRRLLLEARFTQGLRNVATDEGDEAVRTRSFVVLAGIRF
jgi:hypothetical protein